MRQCLFPALSRSLGAGGDLAAAAHQRGIGSNDYFDRYVVFGVPDDDLSETELTEALTQLRAGTPGPEAAELLLRLEDDTHRIRRRLGQRLQAGAAVPAAALLLAVAERYGTLRAQAEFLLSADASARFLAQDLFRTLPHDTHAQVLTDMAASPQGASLAGRVLYDAVEPADTGLPAPVRGPSRPERRRRFDGVGDGLIILARVREEAGGLPLNRVVCRARGGAEPFEYGQEGAARCHRGAAGDHRERATRGRSRRVGA
ncbi:hypothetical protein BOQ63_007370 (plasmid) [Streptomyces viridifaciens]|nr:hypothetical protein BOQ63_007370 [Streptomyces viridifaciens]